MNYTISHPAKSRRHRVSVSKLNNVAANSNCRDSVARRKFMNVLFNVQPSLVGKSVVECAKDIDQQIGTQCQQTKFTGGPTGDKRRVCLAKNPGSNHRNSGRDDGRKRSRTTPTVRVPSFRRPDRADEQRRQQHHEANCR